MNTLIKDFRYAVRTIIKSPGFAAIAIAALALGIGANTAIFSITDQILLRLLPVYKPEQLVLLRSPGPMRGRVSSDGDPSNSFSYPMYKEIRDKNNVFDGVLARYPIPLSVSGEGQTERANGELVSGNYFEVLGVQPAIGRMFDQEDDKAPGASPILVLSHGYWTRHFASDPNILNKSLVVNGLSMTVVGVSRAGFTGIQVGRLPDLFIPMSMKAQMTPNWDGLNNHKDYWLSIMARLKPGLTAQQAQEQFAPIYRGILEEVSGQTGPWPGDAMERYLNKKMVMEPGARGRQILQRDTKQPLLVLTGMVGLVLLIACANVANLLMARGAARQREIAIRMAIGAGRWRLIRQFLAESLVLSVAGGGIGLFIAWWTTSALIAAIPSGFGAVGLKSDLDGRMLAFNFALAVFTGLLFGLLPALRATSLNLESTLREQGSSVSSGVGQVRFRKGLVVSQIVLTSVLLVGAGLFARSLNNLKELDLGVRPQQLIEFSIEPELNGYKPAQCASLFDDLHQRIGALPGVESVSGAVIAPFTGNDSGSNITVEGYQSQDSSEMHVMENWIGANYFSTMGTPLLSGREFDARDTSASPKVAIVNETFVRHFFADRDAMGRHFGFGAGNDVKLEVEIIGIVKNSKHTGVRDEIKPFIYMPYSQLKDLGDLTFYVRTRGDVASTTGAVREQIHTLDPNLPIFGVKTLEGEIDESLFADRFLTFLSTCFALLAALLASIGLYGVMAYSVTRRTREIGIRMALGATSGTVSWLVLREVLILAVIGLAVGLPAAYGFGKVAESLLFGVKSGDLLVFIGAPLILATSTLLGGYLPARKASQTDPMKALRYE